MLLDERVRESHGFAVNVTTSPLSGEYPDEQSERSG